MSFTMVLPQHRIAARVDRTNREPSDVAVMQMDWVVEEAFGEEPPVDP